MQIELYPFDAGTDDGVSYMVRKTGIPWSTDTLQDALLCWAGSSNDFVNTWTVSYYIADIELFELKNILCYV